MRIGVLAVQGAFAEHIAALEKLEVEALPVRLPAELLGLDGLVIPGGESTSISRLLSDYDLAGGIKNLAERDLAIMGTCAGMILLARESADPKVKPLGLMDIRVKRNAFGRQIESFEAELAIPALGEKPFPGVFIRAPIIEQASDGVETLCQLDSSTIVAARQERLLAAAFHPELTDDLRFHKYFVDIVNGSKS
ncbi:MAG: pyridoxal 5'-phosphate synthase glutaminase subunit PdxT [Dehalococcoidales bacterium]|nr:pyridoxal 5'-phosphate synthase glutaminase subunit PdxT [Dehalococcoidales bacterium]